jgi:hypothetical protein
MQVGCVQDGNNIAIVVATKQNWKLWVVIICKHNFWKNMFVTPMDNLISSSSSQGFVPQFHHQVQFVLKIFQNFQWIFGVET